MCVYIIGYGEAYWLPFFGLDGHPQAYQAWSGESGDMGYKMWLFFSKEMPMVSTLKGSWTL